MNRSIPHWKKNKKRFIFISIAIPLFFLLASVTAFNINFKGKIFPNIFVAGIDVSGHSPQEAADIITRKIAPVTEIKINDQSQTTTLETKDVGLSYDFYNSAVEAYNLTRTGDLKSDFVKRLDLLIHPQNLKLSVSYDEEKLQKFISVMAGQISQSPVLPNISIKSGKVIVNKGSPGTEVDQELLRTRILENLTLAKNEDVSLPIKNIDPSLSDSEIEAVRERAEKYLGKSIKVNFEFDTISFSDGDIIKFLNPKGGFDEGSLKSAIDKITSQTERDPQNPKFTFNGGRVTEFQPAADGIKVDREKLKAEIINSLLSLPDSTDKSIAFDVPVTRTPPEVSTDKVNNLGIKELIGRGTSTFFHSIPSRVHNVVLAASRINGTLIKPGDTFSFNDTLGDVSQFTGYQQAYIISEGKTILGDGGGVCQVSTTLFRALLNAGLPITDRTAHAYRVGYYEQNSPPGFDATVYGPSPDLRFKNDTSGYILIEATADPKHYSLVFELYGTNDGRIASTTKPVVTNVTPPPDDLYQDDPTLPTGTTKQIDFKAWGAKVTFNYKVIRAGETLINKTFVSNYRPWQAVYLRGTGPAI